MRGRMRGRITDWLIWVPIWAFIIFLIIGTFAVIAMMWVGGVYVVAHLFWSLVVEPLQAWGW